MALVITIVVIIILAMVTITFLFGEGGIITKTREAAKMSQIEEVREKLEMATGTAIIDGKGHTTIDDYFDLIEEEGIIGNKDSDTSDNGDGTYDVTTSDGFIFQVMPVPEKDNADDILIDYVGEATGPRIREIKGTTTTNSATIEVIAENAENATYKYEYKKEGENDWITVEGQNESSCTIEGLEENVIYNIRVTVEVASGGNKGTATRETSVRTGKMPSGAITFENVVWQGDGTASIVVNTSVEGYTIQYQIVETGSITNPEEELEAGEWKPVENGGNITGIKHHQTVYARLWDGTNGSSYASVDVKDEIAPQSATIELSSISITAGTTVTATVTHNDKESGAEITNCKYIWNTSSTELGTDSSSYAEGSFSSNGQEISKVLSSKGTYYLHVLTVDKAGNAIETVSDGITVIQLVTSVSVSPTSVTLEEGQTRQLTVTVNPETADNRNVTWSSSNSNIASVSSNGLVTAKQAGSANITVTAADGSGKSATCKVTVEVAKPTVQEILEEGDYVYYTDKNGTRRTCVVLYDNSSSYGIEIITMDTVTNIELGNGTGSNDGIDDVTYFTTAMNSYNNAISTLNARASAFNNSTYSTRARCVGSVPNNINSQSGTSSYQGYSMRVTDENYVTDWNQMTLLGIEDLNDDYYWLASRFSNSRSYGNAYFIRVVGSYRIWN